MTPEDIYGAFQAAATRGQLSGDDPDGLADLLGNLGAATLPMTGGQAALGPDSAWLTGTTMYLDSSWSMKLTGRDGGGTRALLTIELTLNQEAPWTLGRAFPALPPSRRLVPDRGAALRRGPSVVAPLVLLQPVIKATNEAPGAPTPPRPRLSGSLPLDGIPGAPGSDLLARYAPFLGTPLFVDGELDFTGSQPVLDLPAAAPGATLQFGQLEVAEVGIRLTTQYPDPYILPEQGAPLSAA